MTNVRRLANTPENRAVVRFMIEQTRSEEEPQPRGWDAGACPVCLGHGRMFGRWREYHARKPGYTHGGMTTWMKRSIGPVCPECHGNGWKR